MFFPSYVAFKACVLQVALANIVFYVLFEKKLEWEYARLAAE